MVAMGLEGLVLETGENRQPKTPRVAGLLDDF